METENYYHLFANGDDARNFITTNAEFVSAFNRFAVCAHMSGAEVLSFSVEDTHPHALIWGTFEKCQRFMLLYESLSLKSIAVRRGSTDGVNLHCELYRIDDAQYLKNAAAYTIVQATKDGKAVMPYDYKFGTGALYFRPEHTILPWMICDDGTVAHPSPLGSLTIREQRMICGTKVPMPGNWLVCNGFILPTNYVDIKGFEDIFHTHNCFRVYLSSNKKKNEEIMSVMSEVRGINLEDMEARRLCSESCKELFGKDSPRHLPADKRLSLARAMRRQYHISFRQLSSLVRIPESELRKYI